MTPVVRDEIGGLVTGPDQFGMLVQKNGGLDFPRVHVGEQRGDHPARRRAVSQSSAAGNSAIRSPRAEDS